MRTKLTIVASALIASMAAAHATPVITTNLTMLPGGAGKYDAVDLSAVPTGTNGTFSMPNGLTLKVNTTNPELAGVAEGVVSTAYAGNNTNCVSGHCYGLSGVYAPPVTDSAGDFYQGKFLSTGNDGGTVTISTGKDRHALALLWGSVDASNQLQLRENGVLVDTILGNQISATPNGSQGYGGSFYVLINDATAFNQIVLSSGVVSFEAAEFEVGAVGVPAPAIAPVFGVMLAGLLRRRRRAA